MSDERVDNGNIDHRFYDELLTKSRRILWNDKVWRQGPERVYDVSSEALDFLKKLSLNPHESTYIEIGCGPYHPLGVSTVMYLNGIGDCTAIDKQQANNTRSAEALYDLLAACALEPKRWNMIGNNQKDYFDRLYSFDIKALKNGDLMGGIKQTPLKYVIGNLENTPIQDNTISIATSRATMEHILDFRKGIEELYRIMKPNGISLNSIDLSDHRVYKNPKKYNMWSFLKEDEDWSDGLCNRLRMHEILEIAKDVGFKTKVLATESHEISPNILSGFSKRYSSMPIEELKITSFLCVFRK